MSWISGHCQGNKRFECTYMDLSGGAWCKDSTEICPTYDPPGILVGVVDHNGPSSGGRFAMASRLDPRNDPEVAALLKKLPATRYPPLVGASDLREIVKVFGSLPALKYPIDSAGELIEKLGGPDKTFDIVGVTVDPVRMIKYMPAYYFPIASSENFIEKMAELIRNNRDKVDMSKELDSIKAQMPKLNFPIHNIDEFLKILGTRRKYKFQNRVIDPQLIREYIPPNMFPIQSEEDFYHKLIRLIIDRPLIVKD